MTTADYVSTVVAGLAVLVALGALVRMLQLRGRNPVVHQRAADGDAVSVGLIPAPDGGQAWRLMTNDDTATTSVDIFSYRRSTADGRAPWRHELMDDPVALVPGEPVHLPAPAPDGTSYDVSIAWVADGTKGRRYVTVRSAT